MAAGSASLEVHGMSKVSGNRASSGSAVHSSSQGGIHTYGGSLLDISGTGETGIVIVSGAEAEFRSTIQCGIGENLAYEVRSVDQAATDWEINCTRVISVKGSPALAFLDLDRTCAQFGAADTPLSSTPSACRGLFRPLMTYTTGSVGCRPCASGLYNLNRGKWASDAQVPINCSLCPFGGRCSTANDGTLRLAVQPDFWGRPVSVAVPVELQKSLLADSGGSAWDQRAMFLPCPPRYCCSQGPTNEGCLWDGEGACVGNRDPSAPLCGGCLSGYSWSVTADGCIEDQQCGDLGSSAKYVSQQLLYWLCLCVAFLYLGRFRALLVRFPAVIVRSIPAHDDGAVSAVIYYFQLVAIAVPQGRQRLSESVSGLICVLGGAAGLQGLPSWEGCTDGSYVGGVCMWEGMTATEAMAWPLGVPGIMLGLLCIVAAALRMTWKHRETRMPLSALDEDAQRSSLISGNPSSMFNTGGSSGVLRVSSKLLESPDEPLLQQAPDQFPEHDAGGLEGRTTKSVRPAVAKMLLYCYSGLVNATSRLLNCVELCTLLAPVDANAPPSCLESHSVLFYAGEVGCHVRWQWPLWLLLLVLVSLPVAPLCLWALRTATPERHFPRLHIPVFPSILTVGAMKKVASEPFLDGRSYWGAVLVVQRLVMVFIGVFINEETSASVGMMLVAVCGLVLQMQARPYRETWVNTLQVTSGLCLVSLTILNSSTGFFVSVGFDPAGTPLEAAQHNTDILMLVILFLPLVYCAYCMVSRLLLARGVRGPLRNEHEPTGPLGGSLNVGGERQHATEEDAHEEEKQGSDTEEGNTKDSEIWYLRKRESELAVKLQKRESQLGGVRRQMAEQLGLMRGEMAQQDDEIIQMREQLVQQEHEIVQMRRQLEGEDREPKAGN